MEEIKHIFNPENIYIERKEIYSGVFKYSLPWGYYFESCGTNFGNVIYAREVPDNYYVVKRKSDAINTDENSQ